IAELDRVEFNGDIFVIDHIAQVKDAVNHLSSQSAIGFDTETKPAFKRGQVNNVALLRLATDEECYLFRLNKIGLPKELEELMRNKNVKKIGLSLRDDFAAIRKRTGKTPENFIDLQQFVDNFEIEANIL